MKYPLDHGSTNWSVHMTKIVHDILAREHNMPHAKLEKDLVNKAAATVLGHDLSEYDNSRIPRDDIRKIAVFLLGKSHRSNDFNYQYLLRSQHAWALKSYDYITRNIEDNIIEVQNPTTTIDTLVIGEFKAVMLVPRILKHKSLNLGA